ncbi:MAG: hypothetical protein WC029_02865 [Sulfuricella sp.]|jgi:hypothetical protein
MKLNKIAASCALALAAMSSQAFALTAFETPDLDVFLSGASAPQNILGGVANAIFDAGYITFYDDNGTTVNTATLTDHFSDDGKGYRAYFGTVKAGNGTLSGKKVILQHRAKGGSVWGVDPVARKQGIANLNVSAGSCEMQTATKYACAARGEDTSHATALPNRVPDFGVSDVEPNMFKAPYNVEPGASQLTAAEAASLTNFGTNAVMFGVPVNASVPATSYISKAALGALLTGDVQDWTLVDATAAPVGGTQVVVCRRVQGSGTQASYNNVFSHFPCETNSIAGSGSIPPAEAASSASMVLGTTGTGTAADPFILNPADGYTVVEGASSGNVRDCLTAAHKGNAAHGGKDLPVFQAGDQQYYKIDFTTGGYGAVGILSMDSAGLENGWTFRSLDGVAPTKDNMLLAKYDLVMEQSIQYPATTPAGLKKDFMNLFITKASDPVILNGISSIGVRNSVSALPVGSNTPVVNTTTGLVTNNVMVGTRNGNSCTPIRKLY